MVSGQTATIVGPFPLGELRLSLAWADGTHTLFYIVEPPPVPKDMVLIPAGEFQMGSSNDALNEIFDELGVGDDALLDELLDRLGPILLDELGLDDDASLDELFDLNEEWAQEIIDDVSTDFFRQQERFSDERPMHTVYVDAFYMDKYEVTNTQYRKFLLANPKGQIPGKFADGSYLSN